MVVTYHSMSSVPAAGIVSSDVDTAKQNAHRVNVLASCPFEYMVPGCEIEVQRAGHR